MRTLLTYLLAEQKKKTRKPYLRVRVYDQVGGINRLHWDHLYAGAEPAGPHALSVTTYFNRLRVDPATATLYHSRTVGATPSWASLRTATARCAMARYGNNLLAFAVDSATPTRIYLNTSDNLGLSWAGWTLLCTAGGTVAHLAATAKTNGDTLVVFAVGATVYKIKRVSAVWGSITAWTNTAATITGLAAHYWLDYNLIVAGTEATSLAPSLWQCIYGDGYSEALNAWSPLAIIAQATDGSAIAYSAPFLDYADTWRLTYRHTFTGTVAYDRIDLAHTPIAADFVDNLWSEPRPFALDHDYGLALTNSATHAYAATPATLYGAPFPDELDVSADVLSCIAHDYPLEPRGATVRLRNHDGRYNTPGVGALIALSPGARLDIGPGYYVPYYGSNQASSGPSYYIDTIEHVAEPGRRELVIHAGSAWDHLARWRPGRPYRWLAGTRNYFQILSAILAKMSLEFSAFTASPKVTDAYPDFAISPSYDPPPYISGGYWRRGTWYPKWTDPPPQPATQQIAAVSALSATRQLYSHLEDRPLVREDVIYNKWPLAADASVYPFGTYHAILAATYRSVAPDNHFLAFGDADLTSQAIDYDAVDLLHDQPRVIHDRGMTTAADVTSRAAREARDATISSRQDTITIPPHCGIELWDLVDVTDATLGLSAAKRRVIGITLLFDPSGPKPVYQQMLTLGAP